MSAEIGLLIYRIRWNNAK